MSYESGRKKLNELYQTNVKTDFNIEHATFKQNRKEKIIKLSQPNLLNLGVIKSFNSGWITLTLQNPAYPGNEGTGGSNGAVQAETFEVSLTLPEQYIPYARMELGYESSSSEDVMCGQGGSADEVIFSKFSVVEDIKNSNYLKKVTWHCALTIRKGYFLPMYNIKVKFYFSLLNL